MNSRTPESLRLLIPYLLESVFLQVKTPTEQIFNNGQSLGSMFAVKQGHSGTIDNPYILPPVFEDGKNIQFDHGSVGRILDRLLSENKLVKTAHLSSNSPQQLLSAFSTENNVYANIDIGAFFKGRSNLSAALEINEFFSLDPQSKIQGVLFFNDETNTLDCLKRGHHIPKSLPNTDEETIQSTTGLSKVQLFVYLGHRHRVGVNLKLPLDAHAVATLGEKTNLRDLAQGSMRMRELMNQQRVDFFIPQGMEPFIREKTQALKGPLTIQDSVLFALVNSLCAEPDENLKAAIIKMGDCASRFILDLLYEENDPKKEAEIYENSRCLFVRDLSDNLFQKFAHPTKTIAAAKFLEGICESLSKTLQKIAPLLTAPERLKETLAKLNQIAVQAEKHLAPFISLEPMDSSTVESIEEEETNNELLSIQLQEVQQTQYGYYSRSHPHTELSWNFSDPEKTLERMSQTLPLSEVLTELNYVKSFSTVFSPEIGITPNFLHTGINETNLFDAFQKTPHEAVVYQNPKTGKTGLLILSSVEASLFKKALREDPKAFPFPITLLAADGTPIAQGPAPAPFETTAPLIIEYLFFGAKSSQLGREPWKKFLISWLKDNRSLKRDFYLNILLSEESVGQFKGSFLESLLYQDESLQEIIASKLRSVELALLRGKSKSAFEYLAHLRKELPKLTPIQLRHYVQGAERLKITGEQLLLAAIPFIHQLDDMAIQQFGKPPYIQAKNEKLMEALTELIIKKFSPEDRVKAVQQLAVTYDCEADLLRQTIFALAKLTESLEASTTDPLLALHLEALPGNPGSLTTLLEIFATLEQNKSPFQEKYRKMLEPYVEAFFNNGDYFYGHIAPVDPYTKSNDQDQRKLGQIKTWFFTSPKLTELGIKFFLDPICQKAGTITTFVGNQASKLVYDANKASQNAPQILKFLLNSQIPYALEQAEVISKRLKIPLDKLK